MWLIKRKTKLGMAGQIGVAVFLKMVGDEPNFTTKYTEATKLASSEEAELQYYVLPEHVKADYKIVKAK